MGKQGPCYHCGVTSTPLWRNGPPEKPVLCNACGSRWRTKGTLTNYIPLHARAELVDSEDYSKKFRVKPISIKIKQPKLNKRKYLNDNIEVEDEAPNSDQSFCKVYEEDTSNRSSSGSAISYSESYAHFGSADASDFTGSAQSVVWDSLVPSRKRTCVGLLKPSPVEKLTKDLYCILHEQRSSHLSGSSEEDLLFESGTALDSAEIGHGGVLIKHPNVVARDDESEASSLPIDSKTNTSNDTRSVSTSLPVNIANKGMDFLHNGSEKVKKPTGQAAQEPTKRDKIANDKLNILQNSDSPLKSIELIDIVNYEEFTRYLTHEEQKQLMKYLPSTDTDEFPGSLKDMFDSPQFAEALSTYQCLLLEGILDLSFSRVKIEECRTLKRLVLVNVTQSKWVEHYEQIKCKTIGGKEVGTGIDSPGFSNLVSVKRTHDNQNQNFPEPKCLMKSPRRVTKCETVKAPPIQSPEQNSSDVGIKTNYEGKDIDNEGSCFSPRSLFAFPPDGSSSLDSLQFSSDSSNQDLLFDMPSYTSFTQAELIDCHLWKQVSPSNSSLTNNRNSGKEETLRPVFELRKPVTRQ